MNSHDAVNYAIAFVFISIGAAIFTLAAVGVFGSQDKEEDPHD